MLNVPFMYVTATTVTRLRHKRMLKVLKYDYYKRRFHTLDPFHVSKELRYFSLTRFILLDSELLTRHLANIR